MPLITHRNKSFLHHTVYLLGLLCLLLITGCATRGNVAVLESQLRMQEAQVREIQAELETANVNLEVAQKEASALRNQLASNGEQPILSEDATMLYRTKGIQINKLLTGGLDEDNNTGDEVLNTVIVPVDAQGELVKVPGKMEIQLFDMTLPEASQRIGYWVFSEEKSQKNWHHGYLVSGYQFKLPWQTIPHSSKLLLHARLTTADGRQFDISEKVTITPPTSQSRFVDQNQNHISKTEPIKIKSPKHLPRLPVDVNDVHPFSKVSQEIEKKTSINKPHAPLGESPWKKPRMMIPATPNFPLKTSDRRSNPFYEAQSGKVIR